MCSLIFCTMHVAASSFPTCTTFEIAVDMALHDLVFEEEKRIPWAVILLQQGVAAGVLHLRATSHFQ